MLVEVTKIPELYFICYFPFGVYHKIVFSVLKSVRCFTSRMFLLVCFSRSQISFFVRSAPANCLAISIMIPCSIRNQNMQIYSFCILPYFPNEYDKFNYA